MPQEWLSNIEAFKDEPITYIVVFIIYILYSEYRFFSFKRSKRLDNGKLSAELKRYFILGTDLGDSSRDKISRLFNDLIDNCVNNTRDAVDNFITKRFLAYKELLVNDYNFSLEQAEVYAGEYKRILQEAFKEVKINVKARSIRNGFTTKNGVLYKDIKSKMIASDFNKAIGNLKDLYLDILMPVPLKFLMSNIDDNDVKNLGDEVYDSIKFFHTEYRKKLNKEIIEKNKLIDHHINSIN